VLALILLGMLWLQRGALRATFLADDFLFLDQVRLRSLVAALAGPDPIGNFARPVGRQLYFWLVVHAGGESPLLFHVANLAFFLAAVALLFVVARRLAGTVAAAIATAFVGLHYAADVPLLWASGSQDLLALVGALGALALFLAGRGVLAGLALLAALLSKETVVFTPLVAVLAARRHDEPWGRSVRRAWPLGLAVAAWAGLWVSVALRQPGARQAVSASLSGLAAAYVHLAQVALGFEWRRGGEARILSIVPPLLALVPVLVALALAGPGFRPAPGARRVGLAWALLGALPVAAVAPVWSSYYYLFALCGVGLLLGTWLASRSRDWTMLAIAFLAWGSQNGRSLDEFITAPGAWTTQSHVNDFYIERATTAVRRYLLQLHEARPRLPRRSTIFFGGLPAFIGFQSGDGSVVRWAYQDTSLRSYYLTEFTAERYRRGPAFVFTVDRDSMREKQMDRELLRSFAATAMISERPQLALDILSLPAVGDASDPSLPYWQAWPRLALGDTAAAYADLRRAGMTLSAGPVPEIAEALKLVAAGDSIGAGTVLANAIPRHALDPGVHALFGGLAVNRPDLGRSGAVEAYAATLLAPDEPRNWLLLGLVQMRAQRSNEARRSLERFFALGGSDPAENEQAQRLLDWLKSGLPGGERVQEALRRGVTAGP
jgi:hypothetical protein